MGIFVEAGADVNAKDNDGRTALMNAAYWGSEQAAYLLLLAGADIHAADNEGQTALMIVKKSTNMWDIELAEQILCKLLHQGWQRPGQF